MIAEDLGPIPEIVGMRGIGWEYRYLEQHPQTVNYNTWSTWIRVEPRNAYVNTVADSVRELQAYIAQGYRYELRPIYVLADGVEPTDSMAPVEQHVVDGTQATWCQYIAGMLGTYLQITDNERLNAIAGIIQRRLWSLPHKQEPKS